MNRIGERLRAERIRLKLSQCTLGAIGGVGTNAQGNYESGIRSPQARYLQRISTLGINVGYVITGDGPAASSALTELLDITPLPDGVLPVVDIVNPVLSYHLSNVSHQLSSNLHGFIHALQQMTLLFDACPDQKERVEIRAAISRIKTEAELLASSTTNLMFAASRVG
jgi:transcriptional regulator with XRE-family HTH domain